MTYHLSKTSISATSFIIFHLFSFAFNFLSLSLNLFLYDNIENLMHEKKIATLLLFSFKTSIFITILINSLLCKLKKHQNLHNKNNISNAINEQPIKDLKFENVNKVLDIENNATFIKSNRNYRKIHIFINDFMIILDFFVFLNLEMPIFLRNTSFPIEIIYRFFFFISRHLINIIQKEKSIFREKNANFLIFAIILINYYYLLRPLDGLYIAISMESLGFLTNVYVFFTFYEKNIKKTNKERENTIKEQTFSFNHEKSIQKIKFDCNLFGKYICNMNDGLLILKENNNEYILEFYNETFMDLFEIHTKKNIEFKDLDLNCMVFSFKHYKPNVNEEILNRMIPPKYFTFLDILTFSHANLKNSTVKAYFTLIKSQTDIKTNLTHNVKLIISRNTYNNIDYNFITVKKIDNLVNLKEKNAFKSRLISSLSHELKTPLNGTIPILEDLKDRDIIDPAYKDFCLGNALASLKLLENALNNIIDYSLMISEEFMLNLSVLTLESLLTEIQMILTPKIELKCLRFSIKIDNNLYKKTIKTDYIRLRQVLLNLLLNSIQFTQNNGTISLVISTLSNSNEIFFIVEDTGIGIEEVMLKKLKEKLKNSENNDFQMNKTGNCLGLIISQNITMILGNNNEGLEILSEFNKGTSIKFSVFNRDIDEYIYDSKSILDSEKFRKIERVDEIIDRKKPGKLQKLGLDENSQRDQNSLEIYKTPEFSIEKSYLFNKNTKKSKKGKFAKSVLDFSREFEKKRRTNMSLYKLERLEGNSDIIEEFDLFDGSMIDNKLNQCNLSIINSKTNRNKLFFDVDKSSNRIIRGIDARNRSDLSYIDEKKTMKKNNISEDTLAHLDKSLYSASNTNPTNKNTPNSTSKKHHNTTISPCMSHDLNSTMTKMTSLIRNLTSGTILQHNHSLKNPFMKYTIRTDTVKEQTVADLMKNDHLIKNEPTTNLTTTEQANLLTKEAANLLQQEDPSSTVMNGVSIINNPVIKNVTIINNVNTFSGNMITSYPPNLATLASNCIEILVVDDDPFNLLSMEIMLKSFNIKCVKASNGKEAIENIKNFRCNECNMFRMIFMDYQMPVMDGVQCAKEIGEMMRRKEMPHIPIIGCTAFTTKHEVISFLNSGVKDVIFKPINKEIISRLLKEWIF